MHDPETILRSAFHGSLNDLREQYELLEQLEPSVRSRIVEDANSELFMIENSIADAETEKAKIVLLEYQYITRIEYDIEKSKRHFIEKIGCLWKGNENDFSDWSWNLPPKQEFISTIASRLQNVDFYTQTNLLTDQIYGLSFPSVDEDLLNWSKRVDLDESDWSWRYDNLIKEEQGRWFTSHKRIAEIEAERINHRKKSIQCINEISPIFASIYSAKTRLEELKGRELWLSVRCSAINRAAEALDQGVQLKHLLLEEAHGLDNVFKAVTRGM